MPAENEMELLTLAANGDRAAFAKLVIHYQSTIIAKATSILPPSLKHQAEDVTPDAAVSALMVRTPSEGGQSMTM